jgi:hypothetical protein
VPVPIPSISKKRQAQAQGTVSLQTVPGGSKQYKEGILEGGNTINVTVTTPIVDPPDYKWDLKKQVLTQMGYSNPLPDFSASVNWNITFIPPCVGWTSNRTQWPLLSGPVGFDPNSVVPNKLQWEFEYADVVSNNPSPLFPSGAGIDWTTLAREPDVLNVFASKNQGIASRLSRGQSKQFVDQEGSSY